MNVLPAVSKLFGRIIHKKMNFHVDHYLPPINASQKRIKQGKSTAIFNKKIEKLIG